jgi:probable HAF family extracellular repeat protein
LIQVSGHLAVTARFRPAPEPTKAIRYEALDLSHLGGPDTETEAEVLDDTGAVAGRICGDPAFCYAKGSDVFLWNGTFRRFHVEAGTVASVGATAAGRVAGTLLKADGSQRAFTSAGSDLVELPTLGGEAFVRAMNASGVVVGASVTQSGEKHAAAWKDGSLIDLAARTGMVESVAMAIDENGRIAILACHQAAWPSGCRAIIVTDSSVLDLGAIPDEAWPLAMSPQGSVVGFTRGSHAFAWTAGQSTDLDRDVSALPWPSLGLPAGGQLDSSFWAVAASGDAVGQVDIPISEGGAATAILWKDGTLFDLTAGVEPPMRLHSAIAINAKGQILARTGLQEWTGVLLTPR